MNKESWDGIAETFSERVREIARHDRDGVLAEEIARLAGADSVAVDLGCGIGSLLSTLADHFGSVHGFDYSEELVRVARANIDRENVSLHVHDLTSMTRPDIQADVSFSVNVLIDPSFEDRQHIAETIAGSTRIGGHCVVVAQSFESVLHTYQALMLCREYEGDSRNESVEIVEALFSEEVSSVVEGIVDYGGELTKCYLHDELKALLDQVGFRVERIRRVPYGWDEEIVNAPDWLGEPYPWDWLAVGERVTA